MIDLPRRASAQEMPVLDLADWLAGGSPDALVAALHAACTNTGFFYVSGHGVPAGVVDNVFDATRRYFDLPQDTRMADVIDPRFRRGFMPYGRNKHAGFDADLKESFDFAVDLPMTDPDVAAGRPLHGPNRWPACAPWLKDAAEDYHRHTWRLGLQLLRLFALALGQREDFFLQWAHKPLVGTRLFHYPPQPVDTERALGVAPHTDYGMVTILAQDPIGGLELLKRDGEWVAAPWIEDTFVVNLGDLFKVWTNDVFVSNVHRVVNRTGRERYSIPTFLNLDFDAPVVCLPSCLAPGETPRHAPTTSGEYLLGRFAAVQGYTYRAPQAVN
ncbi:MAG: 2OG-Fe(II) oxygenase [Rhizobacter sp.]|nr:2OG-Fe(II) oxygenase [Rhizobacter sp.]